MKIVGKWVAGLFLIILLVISACAKVPEQTSVAPTTSSETTSHTTIATSPTGTPKPTGPYGELRLAISSLGNENFDPIVASGTEYASWAYAIFDYVVHKNGNKIAPGIAERWEIAPDGLSWTFYIRKGVKFHNGEDLRADDVKFTLERYMSKDAYYAYVRDMVASVEIIDDYTLRVNTKGTQPYLGIQISQLHNPEQGAVMPKDYIEQRGIDNFKKNPVGSGPFRFIRHIAGDTIEFEALNTHWRANPAFKKLTMILMPEETTRVASLKTGAVDVIDVGLEFANELELAGYRTPKLNVYQGMVILHGAYASQTAKLPIADIRVRQALNLAIDREEVAAELFNGKATLTLPPFVSESSADLDIDHWKDYAKQNLNIYDPAKAKQLLDEAGYPNGFSIKLWTFTMGGRPWLPEIAQVILSYWFNIGVKAELVPTDWGTYAPMRKGTTLMGNASTYAYPTDNPLTPKNLSVGYAGTGTFAGFSGTRSDLDKLIQGAYSEGDNTKRAEMLAKVIMEGSGSFQYIPMVDVPAIAALGPKVDIEFDVPAVGIGQGVDIARHRQ